VRWKSASAHSSRVRDGLDSNCIGNLLVESQVDRALVMSVPSVDSSPPVYPKLAEACGDTAIGLNSRCTTKNICQWMGNEMFSTKLFQARRVGFNFTGSCALALGCWLSPAAAAIVIDGQPDDWSAVPILAQSAEQSVRSMKVTLEDQSLLVLVQGQGLIGNYNIFLNTDGNPATGHQSNQWRQGSGADFLVSNGALYRSTGPGWSWTPIAGAVDAAANSLSIEIRLPLRALGLASSNLRVAVGVQALTSAWQVDSVLPKSAELSLFSSGVNLLIGKGIIIPAYLPLEDAYNWNVLKEGAAVMASGRNPAFRDFWVTVNSAASGPFTTPADWAKAAAVWTPIRGNGGKIFGYVHTCVQPTGPQFRSLATVKGEITAWVNGYPQIDGIWLDEFYPRFEIADRDGVASPTYPNGLDNAPMDRGFVNSASQFNGQQINPAGGYYDQLVKWIRATYPTLRIIGNAGGALYSNQLDYSDLVDVLVSFEQNFDVAINAPVNDWRPLKRQIINSKSGQLALIHRNTTNLAGAIDQALAFGYPHVYTTNRVLENNIWGGLPLYLTSEIQYIADHQEP
jgi:Spherulation-specific family 4